jgi:hypothetical protein
MILPIRECSILADRDIVADDIIAFAEQIRQFGSAGDGAEIL